MRHVGIVQDELVGYASRGIGGEPSTLCVESVHNIWEENGRHRVY